MLQQQTTHIPRFNLVAGDHGSTYGGNPLVTAVVSKVLDLFEELKLTDNVKEVGEYLSEKLEAFAKAHADIVVEHRGYGLIQGLEFNKPVSDIIAKAMEKKLLLINAGVNVIRFIPALIAEKKHVDEMIAILEECI